MTRRLLLPLCLLITSAVAACGPSSGEPQPPDPNEQPYPTAIQMMCEVDKRAQVDTEDVLDVHNQRDDWMKKNVMNPDAIEFMTLISVESMGNKADSLQKQATKTGLASCPLAEAWKKEASTLE